MNATDITIIVLVILGSGFMTWVSGTTYRVPHQPPPRPPPPPVRK